MIILCSFLSNDTFWTAFTAIGTSAMALVALITYINSIKKGIIDFDLVCKKGKLRGKTYKFWCLRICNIGERALQNVSISFDQNFINSLPIEEDINRLKEITKHPINIRANGELLYILCPLSNSIPPNIDNPESIQTWLKEYRNKPINIYYTINNGCNVKCKSLILARFDTQNIIFYE